MGRNFDIAECMKGCERKMFVGEREREAKEKCGGTYRKLKSFEVGERFVRECKEKNCDSGVPEGRERERTRAS